MTIPWDTQDIVVHSKYDSMLPLSEIEKHLNPKNSNEHPPDQIDDLVEQFKYQGIRHSIIISTRSTLVAAGEGRFLAAKQMGLEVFPVLYQDFESEAQEYAFGVADNAIAARASLDYARINHDIIDLGPDFDLSLLGIKDFVLEPADKHDDKDADEGSEDQTVCPKCNRPLNSGSVEQSYQNLVDNIQSGLVPTRNKTKRKAVKLE